MPSRSRDWSRSSRASRSGSTNHRRRTSWPPGGSLRLFRAWSSSCCSIAASSPASPRGWSRGRHEPRASRGGRHRAGPKAHDLASGGRDWRVTAIEVDRDRTARRAREVRLFATFAGGQTDLPVKQTMVGPSSLAALAETDPKGRADLAVQLGEALNLEILALAAAGCPMVEIDEPITLQIGEDIAEFRAFRAANERLFAGLESDDGPHLSLGLWGGQIDPAGYEDLIALPYRSYLVDVLAGPSAWRFLDAVPPARGIIVGSADARTARLDETEVHVWAMAWAAQEGRGSDRVGCSPNGSLGLIGRHFAHRKCLRLGEAVRIGSMGPLQEVAEALDENPAESKLPELRAMARAVESARGS